MIQRMIVCVCGRFSGMATSLPPSSSALRPRKNPERKYTYINRTRPKKGAPIALRPTKRIKWLAADSIALRLTRQCCKRMGDRTCLGNFSPSQVRDRLEWNLGQTEPQILSWLAGYLIDHRSDLGEVDYMVLTKPVCLKAFQRFHGISDHKLKRARVIIPWQDSNLSWGKKRPSSNTSARFCSRLAGNQT